MREIGGFIVAINAEPLRLVLDTLPDDFRHVEGAALVATAQAFYAARAVEFVEALRKHAAGGFYDAVFAEFCHRQASVLRVSHVDNPNRAR